MRHIFLDSAPLSALSLPPAAGAPLTAIAQWARSCLAAGNQIYVPEVIDYELRRELLRSGKTASVEELDRLHSVFHYLPITTRAMQHAAQLWATARNRGIATGDPKKLDVDVILAAQALTLSVPASDIVVATPNVAHISHFVRAADWSSITP
jgi:predicted nucleic acid-binding protein